MGRVQLVDEWGYVFGSADNARCYPAEFDLSEEGYLPTSIHGVLIDGEPAMVLGDGGGASGVHSHSLVLLGDWVFVAVGRHVVRFTLGSAGLDWILQTDEATCFGVHWSQEHAALISHGELEIARFSEDGELVWSSGGADIFTEGLEIKDRGVEAVDFYGRRYVFDVSTGQSID